MYSKKVSFITESSIIAALYVALTYAAFSVNLASGPIQIRFSEALAILPYFTSAAIPGLFIGCLLANVLTGCVIWDIIFGSIATLVGATLAYAIRRGPRWLIPIPNIVSNSIIVPLVLIYAYGEASAYYLLLFSVTAGEIISCGILGMILLFSLEKYKSVIFKNRS